MNMFRRSNSSATRQSGNSNQGETVSRAATVSGATSTRGGARDPTDLAGLSLNDEPPPPTYQTAVRQSVVGSSHDSASPPAPITSGARHSISTIPTGIHAQAHVQPLPPPVHHYTQSPTSASVAPSIASLDRRSSRSSVASSSVAAPPISPRQMNETSLNRRSSVEDPLAPLGKYDLAVLLDDSPSMTDHWNEAGAALSGVVQRFVKYDKDGIDLFFMNNDTHNLKNVVDASTIRESFESIQPFGSTPTAMILDDIIRDVVDRIEDAKAGKGPKVKPLICLVLTDGRADDTDGLRDLIVEMAGRLDAVKAPPFQLGITFLQIGKDDDAAAFLRELDDDLKADGVRDMVDTLPYEGELTPEFILKAALGSVNRRLDG